MRAFENGYVVFPACYWNDGWFSGRTYYSKKVIRNEIRKKYFAEISGILNEYSVEKYWNPQSGKEEFLRCFRKIRGEMQDNNPPDTYAWLNTKEAIQMIKAWKGKPLDLIHELTRKGVIEKAVRLGCKNELRK